MSIFWLLVFGNHIYYEQSMHVVFLIDSPQLFYDMPQ